MKVLFSGASLLGHLLPQLPLARAFLRSGHGAALLVPESLAHNFADERIDILRAGADSPTILAEVERRLGVNVMANPTLEAVTEAFGNTRIDLSIADGLDAAREWRPDLVVGDPYDTVGPLIAAVLGVGFAVQTVGPDVDSESIRAMASHVAVQYEKRGLELRPARWVLDICPPGMQPAGRRAPAGRLPLRTEAYQAPEGVAVAEFKPSGRRPQILVTFGSVFAEPDRLNPLLRALSATGAGVRTPVGIGTSAELYDVDRAVVDVVPFAPLHDLLRDIDLVFCHGGAGTVLGSLAEGLPMVVVPQGADQFKIADLAVAAGAAVKLLREDVTPATVAEAVEKMANDAAYAENARRIAQEIALMPSPDEVARRLVDALR